MLQNKKIYGTVDIDGFDFNQHDKRDLWKGGISVMQYYDAYAFKCDKTLEELFGHLNAETTWKWYQRDSDYFGEYISSRVVPDYAMLKIFVEKDNFVLDIRYDANGPKPDDEWEDFLRGLIGDFLPSVGATDVEPTENYA